MTEPLGFPVAGTGVVCTLGHDCETVWSKLLCGAGRATVVEDLQTKGLPWTRAFQVTGMELSAELDARAEELLTHAVRQAVGSIPPERWRESVVGLVVGTVASGVAQFESAVCAGHDPLPVAQFRPWGPAHTCASRLGLTGPVACVSTACATGTHAIVLAKRWLTAGWCDLVIAAGVDVLLPTLQASFASLKALAVGEPRPFSDEATGFLLGEGAAALAFARPEVWPDSAAAVLLGGAGTADAYHLAIPDPSGTGAAAAMTDALADAGVEPDAVGYVNAHGTGTRHNDTAETYALRAVLGNCCPGPWVGSTKALTGHCQGAAGVMEAVFAVQALSTGRVPGMPWLEASCDEAGFRLVGREPESFSGSCAVSATYGFGGADAAVVFGLPPGESM